MSGETWAVTLLGIIGVAGLTAGIVSSVVWNALQYRYSRLKALLAESRSCAANLQEAANTSPTPDWVPEEMERLAYLRATYFLAAEEYNGKLTTVPTKWVVKASGFLFEFKPVRPYISVDPERAATLELTPA